MGSSKINRETIHQSMQQVQQSDYDHIVRDQSEVQQQEGQGLVKQQFQDHKVETVSDIFSVNGSTMGKPNQPEEVPQMNKIDSTLMELFDNDK